MLFNADNAFMKHAKDAFMIDSVPMSDYDFYLDIAASSVGECMYHVS